MRKIFGIRILLSLLLLGLISHGGTVLPGEHARAQNAPHASACADGRDNDGDGLIDWQYDLGCYGDQDASEGGISGALDNGWTVFERSTDTKIFYVSSADGNDSWSGLAPVFDGTDGPVQTLSKGASLLRSDHADWLLLKRGDTWEESFGEWGVNGRSSSEPTVIASYGPARGRPLIKTGSESGLKVQSAGKKLKNLVILGLHFYAHTRDPGSLEFSGPIGRNGIAIVNPGENLHVEDSWFSHFTVGLSINAQSFPEGFRNVVLRRSGFVDSYATTSHAQGIFVSKVDGLAVIENLFDHNGVNESVPGAEETIFNHNAYLTSENRNVTVQGNISARAASHGLQMRSGGNVQDNAFLRNALHLSFGHVNGSSVTPGGVSGLVEHNVFLDGKGIHGALRGKGLEIGNIQSGGNTAVRQNVFAHGQPVGANSGPAIDVTIGNNVSNTHEAVGVNDLVIENNTVYKWTSGFTLDPAFITGGTGERALNRLWVQKNDFQEVTSSEGVIADHGPALAPRHVSWNGNSYDDADSDPNAWFRVQGTVTSWPTWQSAVDPAGSKTHKSYRDPERSIASYHARLGRLGTLEAFLTEARKQSRFNWRPEYAASAVNAYIREGFELVSDTGSVSTPPTITTDQTAYRVVAGRTLTILIKVSDREGDPVNVAFREARDFPGATLR